VLRGTVQTLKILTIAALAILAVLGAQRAFDYAMDRSVAADVGDRVSFKITEGEDAEAVAKRLKKAGLIRSPIVFTTQLRFTNAQVIPGDYTLRKGMTVAAIVDRVTGKVTAEEEPEVAEFDITIPEGWRLGQIAEEAEAQGLEGGYEAFMGAAETINLDNYAFLQDRPAGATLEGYLFPETYTFLGGEPEYNLRLMLDQFDTQFTPEMRQRAADMGLTVHQVVTLASLVEREAAVAEERPIIAGVYINRINEGWRLDADPTVQYALGKKGDWWPKLNGDEDLFIESPYNTYQIDGLPPGPIANPGLASIQAVLTPEPHNYMYFVAKNDGTNTHAFAVTDDEQNQNICTYLDRCGE
jgi:UPF0755 protein